MTGESDLPLEPPCFRRREGAVELAPFVLWMTLGAGASDRPPVRITPAIARVRPGSRELRRLIDTGSAGSPTFARLIERLERSDVTVFVRFSRCSGSVPACLHLLSQGTGPRTLRVTLDRLAGSEHELVALLAHELEHAAEIADCPTVVDAASLAESYSRRGRRNGAGFETEHARTTARTVKRELAQSGKVQAPASRDAATAGGLPAR